MLLVNTCAPTDYFAWKATVETSLSETLASPGSVVLVQEAKQARRRGDQANGLIYNEPVEGLRQKCTLNEGPMCGQLDFKGAGNTRYQSEVTGKKIPHSEKLREVWER